MGAGAARHMTYLGHAGHACPPPRSGQWTVCDSSSGGWGRLQEVLRCDQNVEAELCKKVHSRVEMIVFEDIFFAVKVAVKVVSSDSAKV